MSAAAPAVAEEKALAYLNGELNAQLVALEPHARAVLIDVLTHHVALRIAELVEEPAKAFVHQLNLTLGRAGTDGPDAQLAQLALLSALAAELYQRQVDVETTLATREE